MTITNEQIEKKLREMACLLGERNDKRPKDQLTWKAATALREQEEEILSLRQEVERLCAQQDSKTITMLFGLMGYLTSMEEPITFSAYHNATSGADILLRLMEANQLKGDCNWDGFKPPKEQDHDNNS